MNTTHIAVDLVKSVFQVAVSHSPGRVAEEHRLSRTRFRKFFVHHPPSHVLMEACSSAHHWGREPQSLGHQVSLLPPAHVARYRLGNKTDRTDARALLEAARNEKISRVPVKTLDQQAITALHRLRSGYLNSRTARINAVRGILAEFGIPIPKGPRTFLTHAHRALDHDLIPSFLRESLFEALEEVRELEVKAAGLKNQLQCLGDRIPTVQYLLTVPGIGILSATALLSTVGDIHRFRSGRSLANRIAWRVWRDQRPFKRYPEVQDVPA